MGIAYYRIAGVCDALHTFSEVVSVKEWEATTKNAFEAWQQEHSSCLSETTKDEPGAHKDPEANGEGS